MPRHLLAFTLLLSGIAIIQDAVAASGDASKPNAGMRYVSVETQSDNAHNRQSLATLSFTLGDYVWLHAGGGKTKAESATATGTGTDTIDSTLATGGLGLSTKRWQYTLDFISHSDGDDYKQRDWTSSLTWRNDHFGIGIDGMRRSTDTQTPVTGQFGRITRYVGESIDGHGVGAHVDVNLTDHLNVFAGGMSYSYGDVSTNHPVLTRLLYLGGSGITRDQALLDHTYHGGVTYQFDKVALSAQYISDTALDSGDVAHTAQLGATIFIGDHWTLNPLIGSSSSDQNGKVTFGSLSANFEW